MPEKTNEAALDSYSVTPGLRNKISAYKICARGWVAQKSMFYTINAKIFQGWVRKDGNLLTETGCRQVVPPTYPPDCIGRLHLLLTGASRVR